MQFNWTCSKSAPFTDEGSRFAIEHTEEFVCLSGQATFNFQEMRRLFKQSSVSENFATEQNCCDWRIINNMQRILNVAASFWMNEKCVFYWIVFKSLKHKVYIFSVWTKMNFFYLCCSFILYKKGMCFSFIDMKSCNV